MKHEAVGDRQAKAVLRCAGCAGPCMQWTDAPCCQFAALHVPCVPAPHRAPCDQQACQATMPLHWLSYT